MALGVALLVAALGWLVLREPPTEPARPPGAVTAAPTQSLAPVPAPPPTLDALVFLDDVRAVAVRSDCPVARGQSGVCRRTLLASDDAGRSFTVRGPVPDSADAARLLLADAGGVVALFDQQQLSTLVRSLDGGRSWEEVGLAPGPVAPLPAGTPALTSPVGDCPERCGELFWVDVVTATSHHLPSQPGGPDGGFWYASPPTPDGVLAASNALGVVAVSADRGRTWNRSPLPGPAPSPTDLPVVLVTGRSRVYVFLRAVDERGLSTALGFRSDDAGASWLDLDYPARPVDGVPPQNVPTAVLAGEVLTTNYRDGVLRSRDGGTSFGEIPGSPEDVRLIQLTADGPVVATRYGVGQPMYWLSRDGWTWTPLSLPQG